MKLHVSLFSEPLLTCISFQCKLQGLLQSWEKKKRFLKKKLKEIIKFTSLGIIGFVIQVSAISFQSPTFLVGKAKSPANVSMLTINTLFAPRRKTIIKSSCVFKQERA